MGGHDERDEEGQASRRTTRPPSGPDGKLKAKDYERELARLHVELVKLQQWVVHKGLKVCIVFEGRDGAGKGGTIKAITERVSPRVFRVVALPAPTEREKSQMYVQRYIPHLPAAGEIVIFDRSWYNRAGVERVMGFCTEEQAKRFLQMVPPVEKAIVDSGIILLKYWLEVSEEEQTRRLEVAHRRRAQDLEAVADGPEVLQPLVRLLAGARRDVQGDRHALGAVVRGPLGRQEAGAAERHHATCSKHIPYEEAAAREGEAAGPAEAARLQGAGLSVQVRAGTDLADRLNWTGSASADRRGDTMTAPDGPARRAWRLAGDYVAIDRRARRIRTQINADADQALRTLYAAQPKARELGQRAKAILVFPKIIKAGLLIGGQGGDGVLRVRRQDRWLLQHRGSFLRLAGWRADGSATPCSS